MALFETIKLCVQDNSWLQTLLSIILFIVIIYVTLRLITTFKRIYVIGISCTIVILGGMIFYSIIYTQMVGNEYDPSPATIIYTTLRAIFSTAQMFVLNENSEALAKKMSITLQVIFWLCYVAAAITFQATILSIAGKNIINYFRIRCKHHSEVYIIIGSCENALNLGENIATVKSQLKKRKRLVLFLVTQEESSKSLQERVSHFNGIVKVISENNSLEKYLKESGLGVKRRLKTKYKVIVMSNDACVPDYVTKVAEYALNSKIYDKIDKKQYQLDIYALVKKVWDSKRIDNLYKQTDEGNNKQIYPCTFHIVNETDLFIRKMIDIYPPFLCETLGIDNSAKAKRAFSAMIIGYGTVGKHALNHLIMNGQFVTQNEDNNKMQATVIDLDNKIHAMEKQFFLDCPGIDICCDIEFKGFSDIRNEKFSSYILNDVRFNNLDYIVIALGNNKDNMEIARYIRSLFKERYKDDNKDPIIMVSERNEKMHNNQIDEKTYTFGCRDDIYTHKEFINENSDRLAKAVHKLYMELESSGTPWGKLGLIRKELNRASADFIPAMLYLAYRLTGDNFKENYLLENGFFSFKKITGKENSKIIEALLTQAESNYQGDKNNHVLVKTERLRWNASMVVLGYRRPTKEEMIAKRRYISHDSKFNFFLLPLDKIEKESAKFKEYAKFIENEVNMEIKGLNEPEDLKKKEDLEKLKGFWTKNQHEYDTMILTKNIVKNIRKTLKSLDN